MIREKWRVDQQYKETFMEILSEILAALRAKAELKQEEFASTVRITAVNSRSACQNAQKIGTNIVQLAN